MAPLHHGRDQEGRVGPDPGLVHTRGHSWNDPNPLPPPHPSRSTPTVLGMVGKEWRSQETTKRKSERVLTLEGRFSLHPPHPEHPGRDYLDGFGKRPTDSTLGLHDHSRQSLMGSVRVPDTPLPDGTNVRVVGDFLPQALYDHFVVEKSTLHLPTGGGGVGLEPGRRLHRVLGFDVSGPFSSRSRDRPRRPIVIVRRGEVQGVV